MAEVQAKDNGGKEKGKQKKMTIRVDFTPMVDMNMLLITFFMLCTSLSKSQTMEISMPSNDKVTEEEQNKVQASRAITVILGGDNQLFYYTGEPNYEDYNSLKETSYEADGLRELLLNRNREVVTEMNQLKKDKAEHKLTEEQYDEKVKELRKNEKTSPIVMIKASDDASYKNLIDVLDEMQICNISKYAIVDMTEGDTFLLDNLASKGELTKNIDRSK